MHNQTQKHTHIFHTHIQSHTHTNTHKHTRTHTNTHTHTYTHFVIVSAPMMDVRMRTYRTLTHMHTHINSPTHTPYAHHTHTYTQTVCKCTRVANQTQKHTHIIHTHI